MRSAGTMNDRISFLTLFGAVLYCHGQDVKSNLSFTFSPDKVSVGKEFNVTCTFLDTSATLTDLSIHKKNSNQTNDSNKIVQESNVDGGIAKVETSDKRVQASGSLNDAYITANYTEAACSDEGEYWCIAHWTDQLGNPQDENQILNITVEGSNDLEKSDSGSSLGLVLGISAAVVVLIVLAILAGLYFWKGDKNKEKSKDTKKVSTASNKSGGGKKMKKGSKTSLTPGKKGQSTTSVGGASLGGSGRKRSFVESIAESATQLSSAASSAASTIASSASSTIASATSNKGSMEETGASEETSSIFQAGL